MLAIRRTAVAFLMSVACATPAGAEAQTGNESGAVIPAAAEEVDLSPAFLGDKANVKAGRKLWKQCRHCHGKIAYPGKAPKLKPERYDAAFVYDRVTNGFGKMPPWKDIYTATQRAQLVAYILSNRFSP